MTTLVEHDACELLDADHIAVKHLFVEYARLAFAAAGSESGTAGTARTQGKRGSGKARSGGDRRALALKICSELTVHAQIEEEIFYPALREAVDAGELLDEAQAEHQQAKDLIARIQAAEGDASLDELVSQLARAVEHHAKEERDLLFPKARSADGLDLDALGAQLKERQQQLASQAG